MTTPPNYVPKNTFHFNFTGENFQTKITFNSAFDSGNLGHVDQLSSTSYVIHTAPDILEAPFNTICRSWFYFSVQGIPKGTKLTFRIKRINILYTIFRLAPKTYKPVLKVGNGPWDRIKEEVTLVEDPVERTIDVLFTYQFGQLDEEVIQNEEDCQVKMKNKEREKETFFAFSYPFSYKESQARLNQLQSLYSNDPDIYFHREVLILSPQRRKIDLLTISSHEGKLTECEPYMNIGLFPYKYQTSRAFKFVSNKPVILLTSRVHPGESPSSHSMNGILNFLLDKEDPRAKLLRHHFVFLLIPMINPDGVYHGFYRLDIHGQNLNRYYRMPEFDKQPAAYAVRRLIQQLHYDNRLFFYCDLHSHASRKGCFLYGNAMNFSMQVETLVFSKLLSLNASGFQYEYCNFSKKHMYARDRGEKLTKEGAGRVSVYRMCNIIHSYTLECGFHYYIKNEDVAPLPKAQYPPLESGTAEVGIPEGTSNGDPIYLTIEHFEEVGKGLLVSILDIFEKNPNAEVAKTKYGNVQNIRNEIASNLSKLKDYEMIPNPRFRYSGLYGVATKTFYNDFLKEDGPKKNNYSFLKEALPYRSPNNEINGKDYQKGQSEVIRDSSPNRDFPEFLRENVPKRNSESPVPEKRASSMGVGQLSNKNSKPNEPQLRTKIGELLASMNLERNKTLIGYGDLGNKHLKLRKVQTPKKFAVKRIDLDLNTLGSPSDTDLVGSFEEDKKKDGNILPQLWDSSPIQKEKVSGVFFEPFSMEESKKSFHVNLIQKIKESKNRRRLLTYRGLYAKDQLSSTESPSFQLEVIKKEVITKEALPALNINQPHIRSKSLSKKQALKPIIKNAIGRTFLNKKNERLEKLDNSERSDNYEFYETNELSFKIERIF